MAYAGIEPFGSGVEDFRAGQICATVANFAGKSLAEGADMMSPDYFINWDRRETKQKSQQEIEAETPFDIEAHSKRLSSIFERQGNG